MNNDNKRDWPDLHVRLDKQTMEALKKMAKKDHRTVASEATHLLTVAVLSARIMEGVSGRR